VKRRTVILTAFIAVFLALGVLPALAQDANQAPERARGERTFPPAWIEESIEELRERIAERIASAEERIAATDRFTEEEKAEALTDLADASTAFAAAEEKAELVGIAISRRQLARSEFRAERRGGTVDYDAHIAGDLDRANRRLEHTAKVADWAEAAGEDVTEVLPMLDNAAAQLEVAEGGGTVEARHDAVHIALAWMAQAGVTLMGM
jgi:hypothetical protein